MKLVVLSPEKELLNCEVTAVELPGKKGRFMVWPGHAPLLSSLQKGVMTPRTAPPARLFPSKEGSSKSSTMR